MTSSPMVRVRERKKNGRVFAVGGMKQRVEDLAGDILTRLVKFGGRDGYTRQLHVALHVAQFWREATNKRNRSVNRAERQRSFPKWMKR